VAKPEVFIGLVNTKFDANRQCTDDSTRKLVGDQMRAFERWIQRAPHGKLVMVMPTSSTSSSTSSTEQPDENAERFWQGIHERQ
jgi:hypothetical protein